MAKAGSQSKDYSCRLDEAEQTRADRPQRSTNLVLHHNVGEHHRKAMLAQLDGRRRRFLRVDPYGPSKGEQIVQRSGQQQPVAAQPHRR